MFGFQLAWIGLLILWQRIHSNTEETVFVCSIIFLFCKGFFFFFLVHAEKVGLAINYLKPALNFQWLKKSFFSTIGLKFVIAITGMEVTRYTMHGYLKMRNKEKHSTSNCMKHDS